MPASPAGLAPDWALPPAAERLLERIDPAAMRLELDATRRLLAGLGDPQERLATVLVAGTNGKGSTAAWLAAMAVAAGYRTGLYTSPHLEELAERVRIDGRAAAGAELGGWLLEAGSAAEAALGGLPTYFELVTAAALHGFAEAGVELAVLEVGMGGRLDATNATEPVLSVITEIGLDHERHLGAGLAEIAGEKAGILRRGRPAIAGCSRPRALAAVRRRAERVGAELVVAATAARWRRPEAGALEVRTDLGTHRLRTPLAGDHQADNLVLAVLAAERLRRAGWERLDGEAIAAGAARCRWPGRLESVALPDVAGGPGREVLLDVAHNPDAAARLVAHLERMGRPYDLLFGLLDDKRAESILPPLAAAARRVVLTRPDGPRGREPAELLPLAGAGALVEPRLERALDRALGRLPAAGPEGGAAAAAPLLVICGSLYLVGAARRGLFRRFGVPPPAASIAAC